ncbi:tetratricopeptide repeat protein [bacterium]|nr:tetratricopeptide repeat protein [bacterium]
MYHRYIIKTVKDLKNLFSKVGRYNKNINNYKSAGNIISIPSYAFRNYAEYLFEKGLTKEAEQLLQDASLFVSNSADALIDLGEMKQKSGNLDEAVDYFEKAATETKNNFKALYLLGTAYCIKGNLEKAEKALQQAEKINNKDYRVYLSWGILLLKKKMYKEAKEKFEISVKYNMEDARSLYLLAITEIELGYLDEAEEKLNFILHSTENNFEVMHNLAYVYFKKKNYDKAVSLATKALKINSRKKETYVLLSDTFAEINQPEKSFEILDIAINAGLKDQIILMSYGNNLQKFGEYKKAINYLNDAVNTFNITNSDELFSLLSKCYYFENDKENALSNAEKALTSNSENSVALEIKARINFDNNSLHEAISLFNKALKNSSNKASIYFMLAKSYNILNDAEKSEKYYEKAIEYDKNNSEYYTDYIKFLTDTKQFKTANTKILSAIKVLGENSDLLNLQFLVKYNLAKENFYRYNIEETLEIAKKIENNYPNSFLYQNEKNELTEGLGRK